MQKKTIRILVVSHTYLTPLNIKKWEVIAGQNRDLAITVLTPHSWRGGLYSQTDQTASASIQVQALRAFFIGNEILYFFRLIQLYRLLKKIKPDVLHVEQGPSALVYFQLIVTSFLCGLRPFKIFFTWINWEEKITLKMWLWYAIVQRFNLLFSHGAIAGNHDAKRLLIKYKFTKNILVLPQLGVDTAAFIPALNKPKKLRIGFVGRFVEEKGIYLLLGSCIKLFKTYDQWELVLVGKGRCEDEIKKIIVTHKLQNRIFIQYMKHHEIPELIQTLSICVLPSYDVAWWREQFGHVLIEAMACGVAVIGSDSGEIPFVINDAGLVFRQKDESSLLAQLERLMQDEQLRSSLAQAGRARVMKEFSHEVIGLKTAAFWLSLVQQDQTAAKNQEQGEPMKTVAIIGAGYVGLVTGACFAAKKNRVIIIENNQTKIDSLKRGAIPFYEPGLENLVAEGIAENTISFTSSIAEGLSHKPDIIFSCVGTPSLSDGSADLSFVESAAREIGKHLDSYIVVVNKSTVPVGTAAFVKNCLTQELALRNKDIVFDVVSNPEFLKEGDAVNDFLNPDRVIIGTQSTQAAQLLRELYAPFLSKQDQFITMSIESAELTKYAANAMLATRISFMNQLALFADRVGADIKDVEIGIGTDHRIGKQFLKAGIGYGGSCFPKDVKALIHMGSSIGLPLSLVQEVHAINQAQRLWFAQLIAAHYGPALATKNVAVLGLAFKPETDDIRSAPALDVINFLLENGAQVYAYDPAATNNMRVVFGNTISYANNPHEALAHADFAITMTEWDAIKNLKPVDFVLTKDKTVFDARNMYTPADFIAGGVDYFCLGRKTLTDQYFIEKTHHKSLEKKDVLSSSVI